MKCTYLFIELQCRLLALETVRGKHSKLFIDLIIATVDVDSIYVNKMFPP